MGKKIYSNISQNQQTKLVKLITSVFAEIKRNWNKSSCQTASKNENNKILQ